MIKVSVIVPAYNCEKYIKKCIDSLVNQTYENVEIVVVNDGSTDNTINILNQYEQLKVKTIKNSGASQARNIGLLHATGDYIMFCDSDDYFEPNAIKTVTELILKFNPDVVQYPCIYRYQTGKSITENPLFDDEFYIEKKNFKKKIYKKMLTGIKFNSLWRNAYKYDVIKDIRFNTTMKTAEDLMFNIDVFTKANSYVYTNKVHYNYFIRKDGLTGNLLNVNQKIEYNKMISKRLLYSLKDWEMDTRFNRFLAKYRVYTIAILKIPKVILQKFKSQNKGE